MLREGGGPEEMRCLQSLQSCPGIALKRRRGKGKVRSVICHHLLSRKLAEKMLAKLRLGLINPHRNSLGLRDTFLTYGGKKGKVTSGKLSVELNESVGAS